MNILEQIKEVINNDINPMLNLHNGSCELSNYEEGVLELKLYGGCAGCPSAKLTLMNGIEPIIKEKIPEVEEIILEN